MIYSEVNIDLRRRRYRYRMPIRKGRPGSPKGQAKPPKRRLDPGFPGRLKKAMAAVKVNDAELARRAGRTRAVIGQYLAGDKTSIDGLLLFDVADALDVSGRWLVKGDALPGKGRPLDVEQHQVLDLHSDLKPPDRPPWINMAINLKHRYTG